MKICLYDARWLGVHGIGRFAAEVISRLSLRMHELRGPWGPAFPLDPLWVSWQIAKQQPDVYFSPGYNPPLKSKVPFVFTVHDLNHLDVPDNSSLAKRLYYNHVIAPACRRAYKVLTVSEYSRQRILEWSGLETDRVINVGNGVGVEFSPNGEANKPDYSYFLYIGARKKHKNLRNLFIAFSEARLPNTVKLVLSGLPDKELVSLGEQLGIGERLVFVGEISGENLPSYYRGALALVLPSLYEGFGLPIVEAMACGTAVVTSDRTSMPEIAGDAGYLIDPESVSSITSALVRVIQNDDERSMRIRNGLIHVKKFSWAETAKKVEDVLLQAANAG